MALCAALAFVSVTPARSTKPAETAAAAPTTSPVPESGSGTAVCADADGDRLSSCLAELVESSPTTGTVTAALARVRQALDTEEDTGMRCHDIVHEVGRAAGRSMDALEALAVGDQLCQGGFVHGVVEEFGYHTDPATFADYLPELCEPYRNDAGPGMPYYDCIHAAGHGAGNVISDDINSSLALCDALEERDAYDCAEGAYMSYVVRFKEWRAGGAPEPRPADVLTDTQLDTVCDEATTYARSCYMRAGEFWGQLRPTDFEYMLGRCAALVEHRDLCAWSVGVWSMTSGGFDGPDALTACAATDDDALRMECYGAIVEINAGTAKSLGDELESMCHLLEEQFRAACADRELVTWDSEASPTDRRLAP